jgi:MFS family permease
VGTPASVSGPPADHRRTRMWPLSVAMCMCVALIVGMVSAINLAVPSLAASDLHPSATELLWVVDGYLLAFACLLVPAGAVADRCGMKGVLLCGMAVFAGGSVVCALAPDVTVLICGRVIAGVGAAASLPTTLGLLVGAAGRAHRTRSIAAWASMTGVGAVLGNVAGGAAVQAGSWRTLFVSAAPLALVALVAAACSAPRRPRHPRTIGLASCLLLTSGCIALLYGLTSVPASGAASPEVLAGLGGAAVLLAAWTVAELRAEHPLLDPRLFLIPELRAGALGLVVVFVGMFGLMYVNGQYLQYAKGYSVFGAGVRLLPMAAAMWIAPRATMPLLRRFGAVPVVGAGLATLAGALFGASFVDGTTPYPWYALCTCLIAVGCGTATTPLSDGIVSALPPDRAGTGSGLQSVTRELGGALGVAVVGSVLNGRFAAALPPALRPTGEATTVAGARAHTSDPGAAPVITAAFTNAMSDGLRTAAALVVVLGALVVVWLARGSRGAARRRHDRTSVQAPE